MPQSDEMSCRSDDEQHLFLCALLCRQHPDAANAPERWLSQHVFHNRADMALPREAADMRQHSDSHIAWLLSQQTAE